MTIQILSAVAITASVAVAQTSPSPADCSFNQSSPGERRVFTNADLERIAACQRPSSVSVRTSVEPISLKAPRASTGDAARPKPPEVLETYWRAQWRSIEQKAKKLRREAGELRGEAMEAARDPKKRPTGRRSPAQLIARALVKETEAKDLETEFEERARREGALPGWIRAKGR